MGQLCHGRSFMRIDARPSFNMIDLVRSRINVETDAKHPQAGASVSAKLTLSPPGQEPIACYWVEAWKPGSFILRPHRVPDQTNPLPCPQPPLGYRRCVNNTRPSHLRSGRISNRTVLRVATVHVESRLWSHHPPDHWFVSGVPCVPCSAFVIGQPGSGS